MNRGETTFFDTRVFTLDTIHTIHTILTCVDIIVMIENHVIIMIINLLRQCACDIIVAIIRIS